MAVPRILLLTPMPPGDASTGRLYLRELCRLLPKGSLCCFSTCTPARPPFTVDPAWIPVGYGRNPRTSGYSFLGYHFNRLSCFPVVQYARHISMPALVAQAVHFGRQHQVDLVWAVLEDHALIYMAPRVATKLGKPLVTTVWDPPEGDWSVRAGYDPMSRRVLQSDFEDAQRASVRCGVASEPMQAEYRDKYGCESVVLIHGIDPGLRRSASKAMNGDGRFVLGFAGNMYMTALPVWEALFTALSSVDWCIEGRQISLRLLAYRAYLECRSRANIEFLGWRPMAEAIGLISQTDVAYAPLWFDERHRPDVQLCFPGKIPTYLASGRPILYHGPEDSSVTRFLRRFPVGVGCNSLDAADIVDSLRRFIVDPEFYARAVDAGQEALDKELGLHVFRERFARLIGVDDGELLPLKSDSMDGT